MSGSGRRPGKKRVMRCWVVTLRKWTVVGDDGGAMVDSCDGRAVRCIHVVMLLC